VHTVLDLVGQRLGVALSRSGRPQAERETAARRCSERSDRFPLAGAVSVPAAGLSNPATDALLGMVLPRACAPGRGKAQGRGRA